MKTFIFTCLSMLVYGSLSAQSVTIDPNANNSGIINVQSTNKGVLVPNMTSTQRTSITSPQKGLLVFDTNTNSFWFHNGTAWVELVSGTSQWTSFNSNLYSTSNYFSLLGGTNIAPLSSGVGNDGTLRIFSPSSGTYANLDGQTLQTRSSNIFGSKTERDFRINPFGGNVGVGVTTPTAKLHLGGSMKMDGSNTLEFGAGVANKENNAGKIGYRTFGAMDALDIVGAGNTVAERKINLWAESGVYNPLTTGGLNIVPLGIADLFVTEYTNGTSTSQNFINVAGGMVMSGSSSATIMIDDHLSGLFLLNPAIVSQYTKIYAISTLNYYGGSSLPVIGGLLDQTSVSGSIDELSDGIVVSDGTHSPAGTYYSMSIRVDDFPFTGTSTLRSKVIFYGIK
jgi:trimeric autotransporter adhesin